jgi:23S rRNA (adenine2030-N6)-methyltransferase
MLSYRHAFHAGNHADVFKHAVLLWCLAYLKAKPGPFAVLDTHAGPGLYDLKSEEAQRSPEWQDGAGRVFDWADAPLFFAPYLDALSAANPDGVLETYLGSPKLIRAALRAQDRLIACELHPEEAATLKSRFRHDGQTHIHVRDGWPALTALLPFTQKRGLVLIDPPYEEEGELAKAAIAIGDAIERLPGGIWIWWRPLKHEPALEAADAELRQRLAALRPVPEYLRADLAIAAPEREGKLTASSLLIVNPPYGLDAALRDALPILAKKLAIGPGAFGRVR